MRSYWEVFRFEFWHHARQRSTWIYAAVFLGFACVTMTTFVSGARGTVFNAPLAIAGATIVASMFGLIVTMVLAGDVATRDAQTRMAALLHTAPLTKTAYLGGRFMSAFVINALLLAAVPAGIVLAGVMQPLAPERLGPFRPAAYLAAYVMLALPNAFVTTALLYSAAVLHRTAVASYVGALWLFVGPMLLDGVLAEAMGRWELAKALDPFGMVTMRELVRIWTPAQKDTLLVGLDGALVLNRALWIGVAVSVLAFTHVRFRFGPPAERAGVSRARRRWRLRGWVRSAKRDLSPAARTAPVIVPHFARTFGMATSLRQTLDIAWRSFRAMMTSRGALVLAFPAIFVVLFGPQLLVHFGTPLLPTTEAILGIFVNSGDVFLLVAAPFLIVVYAGELVWRERDAGMSDIADAVPVPDWVPFVGKLLGIGLALVVLQTLMMAAGMLLQTSLGYNEFEMGLYLRVLFGLQLPEHLLFAVLALAVHVVVNQKYLGHLVVLLAYAFTVFATAAGIEHRLLIFASDPGWTYSDMRGFGPFVAPFLWFKLYWAAWALLFAVGARLLWVRGRARGVGERSQLARRRLMGPALGAAATAVALIVTLGGFIFYNTNVMNAYTTGSARAEQRAEYERRYARYARIPQPRLTDTKLHVEIYPDRPRVEFRGSFTLANSSAEAIEAVHVVTDSDVIVGALTFDRQLADVRVDDEFGHRIFVLEKALEPGDALVLHFDVAFGPRGFRNSGLDASVASNGTSFAGQWLPAIGYQSSRELQDPAARREHGLAERPALPALRDVDAVRNTDGAERTTFDAVVGTAEGQVAIAPGALRRTWTENGRRYFHYVTDAPIRNDYRVFSAVYARHEATWSPSGRSARPAQEGVAIEILHHPGHARNLDRMRRSVQASLDYYTAEFGPYPHRHLRLIEHPGDGNSLHAAPVNISYEEGFSLFNPDADRRGLDFPFAIVAHEVAHQWWGNQLTPAFVAGAPVLTESLAWYSAMGVVEQSYGTQHLQRLLAMMREAYLTPQSRAAVPLLEAYDWFQVYRKGPFAMYALGEYVGHEPVNAALRRLLERFGTGLPPLATSLDLYRELQAATPDALQYLLVDLFERNTFWELSTEEVSAVQDDDGVWQVTLDVHARKIVVDRDGVETDVPMDDLIEIGVFGRGPDREPGHLLYQRMHRVGSGRQRLTVPVPNEPARAGIDPRHLLIDVEPENNVQPIAVRRDAMTPSTASRREK
jgi:ABC-2 type transport system permease protein